MTADCGALAGLTSFPTRFAYDCELKRPGCVNVQAGLGGDSKLCIAFDTASWLTYPTDAMRVYTVESAQQLQRLIEITAATS